MFRPRALSPFDSSLLFPRPVQWRKALLFTSVCTPTMRFRSGEARDRVTAKELQTEKKGERMNGREVPTAAFRLALIVAAALGGACASQPFNLAPRPPDKFEKLGAASGEACGSLLIDGTAYNFIPIMLNSRIERAYAAAVQSVPGATGLVNVTMKENWFWWVIGSTRCVTVTGEAIR